MAVLILKNIVTEGPGTMGDFLKKEGIPFTVVEIGAGEVPPPLEGFSALVILGGPMGVYEKDRYPHILNACRIIREAINREMKVLGICLGSQMIAHCLGASVYPGPEKEIGWHPIELTGEGLKDPVMRKLAAHPDVGDFWRRFMVFHWHGDTFDLPPGAALLAGSKLYRHQALRYSDKVYGFQFHIEITKEMLGKWFQGSPDRKHVLDETEKYFPECKGRAMNFYRIFFKKG
jgi:GMP synthase-like glutamine amidotransferase